MRFRLHRVCYSIALLTMAFSLACPWACLSAAEEEAVSKTVDDAPSLQPSDHFFDEQVLPILQANCFKCHGGQARLKGEFRITSREGILAGGEQGAAFDGDDPERSLLLQAVRYEELEMPPDGKLPDEQIAVLAKWVKSGLPWSSSTKDFGAAPVAETPHGPPPVNELTKRFWSFQPLQRPPVPVADPAWVKTPMDAFVWSRLQAAGLSPSPPADKAALIRRVYYDLIGLPPDPEVVANFVASESPTALEQVVDQLLESPQYGERWARHWLDLVRYAETNSYERDGIKPFVWRYRDYVIQSLNQDKPFDQFALEQLAGDELPAPTAEQLIATGYYRLGRWQDEPVDPVQELYEDLDDIVTTTSQVFLGLTINCARCHDHKIDPIPQQDYYRFLAFFHGLTRYGVRSEESVENASLRSIATPDEIASQQAEVQAHEKRLADVRQQIESLEQLVYGDFQEVEKEEFQHQQHKLPLMKMRVPRLLSTEQFDRYRELKRQEDRMAKFRPAALARALCVSEIGPEPRETFVLVRGNAHVPGDQVQPGFPAVLSPPEPDVQALPEGASSSGRRLALARWITSPQNPLTARVIANRIWQYHFGRGIVRSASDFGFQGTPPTHPELLDWLAADLIDGGWRMKRLHKLIMLSSVYQMASAPRDEGLAADPTNELWWRFDMRRLEAEEIRDSVLWVNGTLNPQMLGPSIYPRLPAEIMAGQSRPGADWQTSDKQQAARRSLYIHTKRSMLVPMIAAFDGPDPDATCPVRFVTTQPTQALGTLNGDFMNEQAAEFAHYLRQQSSDRDQQVRLALARVTQREPRAEEVAQGLALMNQLQSQHQISSDRALDLFCLVALNLNEFIYLD